MKKRLDWLIVDGFSLIHREPDSLAMLRAGKAEVARRHLLARLAREALCLAERITVVFDGRGEGGRSEADSEPGLDVLYSPAGLTADTIIERLVASDRNPARITVVTSDRLERDTVSAAGADSMGCRDFLALCAGATVRTPRSKSPGPGPSATLGDYFPS